MNTTLVSPEKKIVSMQIEIDSINELETILRHDIDLLCCVNHHGTNLNEVIDIAVNTINSLQNSVIKTIAVNKRIKGTKNGHVLTICGELLGDSLYLYVLFNVIDYKLVINELDNDTSEETKALRSIERFFDVANKLHLYKTIKHIKQRIEDSKLLLSRNSLFYRNLRDEFAKQLTFYQLSKFNDLFFSRELFNFSLIVDRV